MKKHWQSNTSYPRIKIFCENFFKRYHRMFLQVVEKKNKKVKYSVIEGFISTLIAYYKKEKSIQSIKELINYESYPRAQIAQEWEVFRKTMRQTLQELERKYPSEIPAFLGYIKWMAKIRDKRIGRYSKQNK